jgi:hypothetical protein
MVGLQESFIRDQGSAVKLPPKDSALANLISSALGTAVAMVLAWVSMHLLIVSLELGITAAELRDCNPGLDTAHIKRAADLALAVVVPIQVVIALALSRVLKRIRGSWPLPIRFVLSFFVGSGCSIALAAISLSTGGFMIVPSVEQFLSKLFE